MKCKYILTFLNNKKLPAGLIVILLGLILGLVLGTGEGLDRLSPGLYFPAILPHGFPVGTDFSFALFAVVLPQMPMTLGNAVIAQADLSKDYFGKAFSDNREWADRWFYGHTVAKRL